MVDSLSAKPDFSLIMPETNTCPLTENEIKKIKTMVLKKCSRNDMF
jgi:hypothetical protein